MREALRRLEGDGHLVRDPGGGIRPSAPNVRSMRELYDVRIVIEELITRRAAVGGDRGLLDSLQLEWRALEAERRSQRRPQPSPEEFVHSDESFHERLAEAGGNTVAAKMLTDLNERIRILRIHDFTDDARIGSTITEHLEIVERVLAGDADGAAAFMRAHVQRSALVVRERVGVALSKMFGDGT